MNKQTAVEFLIEQFETMFKINGVEISPRYRIETISPICQKALELEREQIKDSYMVCWEDYAKWEGKHWEMGMDPKQTFNDYYNETYGN